MRILVFAPHNDDEVLGVGGTIAKYSQAGHEVIVCEVTSGENLRRVEQIQTEALEAHKLLGVRETIFLGLPVINLRHMPTKEINLKIQEVVDDIKPHVVYLPHKGDMNFDHAEVTYSAMVALRPFNNPQLQAIYVYETLSETEWNTPTMDNVFIPNVWNDITETIGMKMQAMDCFKTQVREYPHPRSLEAIEALSKLRGSTVCVKNAESFMLMRSML